MSVSLRKRISIVKSQPQSPDTRVRVDSSNLSAETIDALLAEPR